MPTATKPNLFAAAKKAEPAPAAAKSKLPQLEITPDLQEHLELYSQAKMEMKNWEAKMTMSEGIIKERAKELFLAEYKKAGRNIGSFKLSNVTVSVQDRYTKLTPEITEVIEANFPAVIETTTTYTFNQTLLEKYMQQISDALTSANIPEEDIANLIVATETKTVKKGTIDTLATYGNDKIADLFQAIAPVVSMR